MNNKKNKKPRGGLNEFFTPSTLIVIIFIVYGVLAFINKSLDPWKWGADPNDILYNDGDLVDEGLIYDETISWGPHKAPPPSPSFSSQFGGR